MEIIYIDEKGTRSTQTLEALMAAAAVCPKRAATLHAPSKPEQFALIHKAIETGVAPVLFDPKMGSVAERVAGFGVTPHDDPSDNDTLGEKAFALFFTSGTTGMPTGALKTRDNIMTEVDAHRELFTPEGYERIIVTVPFIHIYGFLAGVMLPRTLGCELLLKEEFWPQELLELHEGKKTLVVTSPVYLKSLLKLRRGRALPNVHFLSSTGLLLEAEVEAFESKYETTLLQLFGSTETGGIATKRGVTPWWTPLRDVRVSADEEGVMTVDSPYVSPEVVDTRWHTLPQPFRTTDLIETGSAGFRLFGRLNEIVKISGKRLAVTELEHWIESRWKGSDALIRIERHSDRLKDESLKITLAGAPEADYAAVAALLAEHYPEIHFAFVLEHVDAVEKNAMGKKVRK
jgi:acyl-coenzyme A synthetase/AMP-(fatty) acid ligase